MSLKGLVVCLDDFSFFENKEGVAFADFFGDFDKDGGSFFRRFYGNHFPFFILTHFCEEELSDTSGGTCDEEFLS